MCFNKQMTLGFSITAVILGCWVLMGKGIWNITKWRRIRISSCFFWFSFMEFLQYVQYLVINDCSNIVNIVFTALGWIHIAYQPLFSNIALTALDPKNLNKERKDTWDYILKFCFVCGTLMSLRLLIPVFYQKENTFFLPCTESIEGMCAPVTCSYDGLHHIKWTFKMLKPSYPFPGIAAHFLNMFIAPILMGQWKAAIILFMTGPFIAALFNGVSDGERSSIWCYFSIAESFITIMSQYLMSRKKASSPKSERETPKNK